MEAAHTKREFDSIVNPSPPDKNPVYAALTALAPPKDWGSISPAVPSKPNRVRVRLTLRKADVARTVEVKLRNEAEVDDVWDEFTRWFSSFRVGLHESSHEV